MVTVLVFGLKLDAPRNVQTRDEDGLLEELGQADLRARLVLARRLDHAQPRLEFAHLPRPSAALARLAQHIPLVKRREFDHVLEFGIEGLVLELLNAFCGSLQSEGLRGGCARHGPHP